MYSNKSIKQVLQGVLLIAVFLMGSAAEVYAKDRIKPARLDYLTIGGVADVIFIDDDNAVANAMGTFSALTAEVTSRDPRGDGSILVGMTHRFMVPDGGFLITEDLIEMVPLDGSPGIFTITVDYLIVEAGGGLEGYEGQRFVSRGFIDSNDAVASVRYDGRLFRKKPKQTQ